MPWRPGRIGGRRGRAGDRGRPRHALAAFPETTPALLDLSDERGEKAVFFLIGENARRHPDLVREIARRGHEIGNHTLTHPQASFWCAGPWRTAREIRGCQEILTKITGAAPRCFRAPVGHRNLFTHPVAAALGLRVVGWTRRGYDADPGTHPDQVLARIIPQLRARDIILLDDSHLEIRKITSALLDTSLSPRSVPPTASDDMEPVTWLAPKS